MTAAHRRRAAETVAREPGRGTGRTVALTSCTDELEHRIALDVLERAAGEPVTDVVACCGAGVLPAPLSTPPGAPCRRCVDVADRSSTPRWPGIEAATVPSWWARR